MQTKYTYIYIYRYSSSLQILSQNGWDLSYSPLDMDSLSMTIPPKAAKATAIASGAVCHVVVKDHYVIM